MINDSLIQIKVPENIKKALKIIADEKGVTVASLLRMGAFEMSKSLYQSESIEEYSNANEVLSDFDDSMDEFKD